MSTSTRTRVACPPGTTARPAVPGGDLVLWAAAEAGRLLADLPTRWEHTQEVAVHAWWVAPGFSAHQRELLVAAAYLHDIGYAAELVDTGFHPLDGARHLQRQGMGEVAAVVAQHSGAAVEARYRGLADELAALPRPDPAVADALTYCDITTSPQGETVDPGPRLAEIVDRHGRDSVVARARVEARVDLFAAVVRTLRRVARGRPGPRPFGVTPVRLACTTVLQVEGVLGSGEDLALAAGAVTAALAEHPHALVCDLALLRGLTPAGAAGLAAAAGGTTSRVVLLEPPAPVLATLRAAAPDLLDRAGAVATSVTEALGRHCHCS